MLYGIDIFSGAGGLSLGAEMAGINMTHAIEIDTHAAHTYRTNHKNTIVHEGDIKKVKTSELKDKDKPVFVVMGGPPCQGFSMSNTRSRNMDNDKNYLFLEFVRIVRDLRPEWFVLENVKGLEAMNGGQTHLVIEDCFGGLGYNVNSKILIASDYGVPQNRNRFFMVGHLNAKEAFEFPEPHKEKYTVEDAFGDLPVLSNGEKVEQTDYTIPFDCASKYAQLMREDSQYATQNYVSRNNDLVIERYRYIKQGENWSAIPDSLMKNYANRKQCHSGIYKRLVANQPSVVISNYRKSMLIHPTQDRGLSVREAARLQSFPDRYRFEGPISYVQQQIGNAVPPLLAKAVFEQIIHMSNH